jgi:outer membrane protein OmpA-like peptidoglycan-associated protein
MVSYKIINRKKEALFMRSISNFRILVVGFILLSLMFCSNDKKDSNPNPGADSNSSSMGSDLNKSSRSSDIGSSDTLAPLDSDETLSKRSDSLANQNLKQIREMNEKLKNVRYPDGNTIEGFEYKKWEIPNRQDFVKWIKASGNVLKEALDSLPESIRLEIAGHADTSGPEEKEGNRLGNLYYSKKRAESVRNSLVKLGFPEKRMAVKGLGSSDPIPGVEGTSAKNRRVTFKLVDASSTSESDDNDK